MAADHPAAVLATLRANPNLTNVFDGLAPKGTAPPYVSAYVYYPHEATERVNAGTTDRTEVTVITHSVGFSAEAARIVARNVRASLINHRMTVTGYQCHPITHEVGLPPANDSTTGQNLVDVIDEWDYTARPA